MTHQNGALAITDRDMTMVRPIRIGNAHGFWGDRIEAAAEMLAAEPDLDYLTLDFLAEVSLSIMASQRRRDPHAGFAADFVRVMEALLPYYRHGGQCRIVTNAGGLNPLDCALAVQRLFQHSKTPQRRIAVVSGDDVTRLIRNTRGANCKRFQNLDTLQAIDSVRDDVVTANAYVGSGPIAEALRQGADLIITGRVADPSLTVGPCLHHYQWDDIDFDAIAGATVAGHLIECGTQVTGGICTDWLEVPDRSRIGFPIAEVFGDGSCVITKPTGSGGTVNPATVKEQLLYEIGDPDAYLSPDATVSITSVQIASDGPHRIRVSGARGAPPPSTLKVSATYQAGYWAAAQLTIVGSRALEKARAAGKQTLDRLTEAGNTCDDSLIETIGSDNCDAATLRVAFSDRSKQHVSRFCQSIMPLITAGPPGTTGYAQGRPKVHTLIRHWPCLIERAEVSIDVTLLEGASCERPSSDIAPATFSTAVGTGPPAAPQSIHRHNAVDHLSTGKLIDIALARSGDKGIHSNIGVIAREPAHYRCLLDWLTTDRVAEHFRIESNRVLRYELPILHAMNFVLLGALDCPIAMDAQGKGLGQILLQMKRPLTDSE